MTETASTTDRVLFLASYNYLNFDAVVDRLGLTPHADYAIASVYGVGHALLKRATEFPFQMHSIKWQATRPNLKVEADRALIFWDGKDAALLQSVKLLDEQNVSYLIIGPDAKPVDPKHFYATLASGDKVPTAPSVIVEPPSKDTRVRVQLSIPEDVVVQYEAQSKTVKQSLEKTLSDRLRSCVNHTSGRGLYFNDEQRSHLERITGGHIITDANMALQKIKVVVELQVAGVTVELNERVLARCTSRAKSERKTFEEYVKKEVIQGLEKSVGLRPY